MYEVKVRPIDANRAIEIIDEWLDSVGTVLVGKGLSSYGELIGCIEDTPTITLSDELSGPGEKEVNRLQSLPPPPSRRKQKTNTKENDYDPQ